MEWVGVASSIIAVVEPTAKVAKVYFEYTLAVKHAQSDIKRLQSEVQSLEDVLKQGQQVFDQSHSVSGIPPASPKAAASLEACSSQLDVVLEKASTPETAQETLQQAGMA